MDARSAITVRPGVGRRVRGLAAGGHRLVIAPAVVSMAVAGGAQAQTASCDDFKAVLAARFESNGVRGYSLEAVPASAPTPADAKVIGNCESGAYKILYRRWGAARAASVPAPVAAVPGPPARRAPNTTTTAGEPAARTSAASAATSVLRPIMPTADAASAAQTTTGWQSPAPAASASDIAAQRPTEPGDAVQPPPASIGDTANARQPSVQRAIDFSAAHWPWIGVLLLVPMAGWIWRAYLSPYDKEGLPRGPRL